MRHGLRFLLLLLIVLLPVWLTAQPVHAQANTGVVAFVGTDTTGTADIYLLDLASSRIARLQAPVAPTTDLAWDPTGQTLAFTTNDGGYGLLRSLRGCFNADATCSDVVYIIPPSTVTGLAWSPDGSLLYMDTPDGLMVAPPRTANPKSIQTIDLLCDRGIEINASSGYLLCVGTDPAGKVTVGVYEPTPPGQTPGFSPRYQIGTYPDITGRGIGPGGQAAVGTLEDGGDSGFYANADGQMITRLANYQVHIYDLAFRPTNNGDPVAVVGAISDSTGDATLRDGDVAELLFYNIATSTLTQVQGLTGATSLAWSPDGNSLLVITENSKFSLYNVQQNIATALSPTLPAGLQISSPTWSPMASAVPLPIQTATPVPTITPFPSPFPTVPPPPTWTPYVPPSATPGSPMGNGCQYATASQPVVVGDTAEVTSLGGGVRLRDNAALTANQLRELSRGTRMVVLSGPICSQGYRWWQVRLEADGLTGWVADSEPSGYWIQRAAAAPPPTQPMPAESITFLADRYVINYGECVNIWWAVQGIKEVYYEGQGVVGSGSKVECPSGTRTYTLTVIRLDNTTVTNTITIMVISPY